MVKYFISENLKTKNTFTKKLTLIMPLLTILLSFFLMADYFQIDGYNWWYVMMLPGLVSLSCALSSRVDGSMRNRGVLSLPVKLEKVWVAKVLVGVKNIFIACMIVFAAVQLCPYVVNIKELKEIPIPEGLAASMILVVTFAWQVPFCMFLGNKIGLFPTTFLNLALNIIFTVLSVEKFWLVVPYSYPSRLMCSVLKILPNGLPAVPGSDTFKPELLSSWAIPFGIGVSVVLFFVITYLTAKWFAKQEAK